MNMYRVAGIHPRTRCLKFRSLRTSSPLEGQFLHKSRSVHPTGKKAGPRSMHVRSNLFDFAWSLEAAANAGIMKRIGHSWPWLIDALVDVCRGWLGDADLPPVLVGWKRTDTSLDPCTFRGVDFEMLALRGEANGKGIAVSSLRSEADFNAVMRYPELVLKGDWPALAQKTGVCTPTRSTCAT